MATYSDILDILYQETNENPNSWGDVLNAQQQLIETAFDTASVVLTGTSYTMDDSRGADATDHYRYGIVNITGNPGGAANVNVPVGITSTTFVKKAWLVIDNTSGGHTITFKTSTGTGVALVAGTPMWCYCDGTNMVNASAYASLAATATTATSATTATTATNATQLGGVAAANYAVTATLLDTRNTWTKGQVVQRATLTATTGVVTPSVTTSNAFYSEWLGAWQLANPTGSPVNGDTFSIVIEQGAGAPHTISFGTQYVFESGIAPTLSTVAGQVDILLFEYCTNTGLGNAWIGTILKNLS